MPIVVAFIIFLPPGLVTAPVLVCQAVGHQVVTVLTAVRTPAPVAASHRRPAWASGLIPARGWTGAAPHLPFHLLATAFLSAPLCSSPAFATNFARLHHYRFRLPIDVRASQMIHRCSHFVWQLLSAQANGQRSQVTDFFVPPSSSHHSTIDRHPPSTIGRTKGTARTARACSSSTSTPSSSVTSYPSFCRHPLHRRLPHCR
jgi:hypothetical protein